MSILIFSTTAAGPGVRIACALANASCDVTMLCPPVNVCHAIPNLRVLSLRRLHSLEWSVLDTLRTERPEIVVPCDDGSAEVLHDIHAKYPEWRSLIERSLGDPSMFTALDSRCALLTLLRGTPDVLLPESRNLCSEGDLQAWLTTACFRTPWIMKQEATSGGVGVRVVATQDAARLAYKDLVRRPAWHVRFQRRLVDLLFGLDSARWSRSAPQMVAQRYIAGRAANVAMFCNAGELLASVEVEVLASKTPTSPSTAVRHIQHAGMHAAAAAIARQLGLTGFHGVDFILEAGTDQAYFLEVNPRVTATSHLRFDLESDLLSAAARQWKFEYTAPAYLLATVALFPHWGSGNRSGGEVENAYQDVPHTCPELVEKVLRRVAGKDFFGFLMNGYSALRETISRRHGGDKSFE